MKEKKLPEKIKVNKIEKINGLYEVTVDGKYSLESVVSEMLVKYNELIDYLESEQ